MATSPNHPSLPPPLEHVNVLVDNTSTESFNEISDEEVSWFLNRLHYSSSENHGGFAARLKLDYGDSEAVLMLQALQGAKVPPQLHPILFIPGVGSRWRQFVEWWLKSGNKKFSASPEASQPHDRIQVTPLLREVFKQFASSLGRIKTYRALALDDGALKKILERDVIFPTGELRHSAEEIAGVLKEHGVQKILVARLFIAFLSKLLGGHADPSISLHDDWQTTSLIASGYASQSKHVYLFKVSAPVVISVGWRLSEVAHVTPQFLPQIKDHPNWFLFQAPAAPSGCYFDSSLTQTERYCFYGMPFLKKNLLRLMRFESVEKLRAAVAPFVSLQVALKDKFPDGEGHEVFTK